MDAAPATSLKDAQVSLANGEYYECGCDPVSYPTDLGP